MSRCSLFAIVLALTASVSASVQVQAPSNGANVSTPVQYVATATTDCPNGVAAMGIYTAPYQLAYKVQGAKLNTKLSLSPGTYNTVVQEWDNCGGATKAPITIIVGSGGGGGGSTFYNLQKNPAWKGYALLPPGYGICQSCNNGGPQVKWSWTPNVGDPSKSGASTETSINGGTTDYADVLWNNHLIGDFSSQNLPDKDHKLVPTLHYFTYDVWFYATDVEAAQALEFDINQFEGGKSFIWGHECRVAGGHEWDTWSNPGEKWVPSGFSCYPVDGWNHLVIQVQRTSDDHLLFQSITLNDQKNTLNRYDSPTSTSWYGVTINYQLDGNYKEEPYSIFLDELNFTYK